MKRWVFSVVAALVLLSSVSAPGAVVRLEAEDAGWFDGVRVGHREWGESGTDKVWLGLYRPCQSDPGYDQDRVYLNTLSDAAEKAECSDYPAVGLGYRSRTALRWRL